MYFSILSGSRTDRDTWRGVPSKGESDRYSKMYVFAHGPRVHGDLVTRITDLDSNERRLMFRKISKNQNHSGKALFRRRQTNNTNIRNMLLVLTKEEALCRRDRVVAIVVECELTRCKPSLLCRMCHLRRVHVDRIDGLPGTPFEFLTTSLGPSGSTPELNQEVPTGRVAHVHRRAPETERRDKGGHLEYCLYHILHYKCFVHEQPTGHVCRPDMFNTGAGTLDACCV